MDDGGHRQGPAHHPDDRTAERPAAMERDQREQSQFRTRPSDAASRRYRDAGFDFLRDAIHRTYK